MRSDESRNSRLNLIVARVAELDGQCRNRPIHPAARQRSPRNPNTRRAATPRHREKPHRGGSKTVGSWNSSILKFNAVPLPARQGLAHILRALNWTKNLFTSSKWKARAPRKSQIECARIFYRLTRMTRIRKLRSVKS